MGSCISERVAGWTDRCMYERVNGWVDGLMNVRTDGGMPLPTIMIPAIIIQDSNHNIC